MIVFDKIEQGSIEWHELRYGKVSGSTLKDLMANDGKPVTENAIYTEILSACFENYVYEESFKTKEMQRGNDLEPVARENYETIKNCTVNQIGFAQLSKYAGISPDGLVGANKAIEIKCPSAATHLKYMRNPQTMVEQYIWQCVMYFVVFEDLEELDFISYRPENLFCPILIEPITREREVRVSAKKTATISQLVEDAKKRIKELEDAIEKDKTNLMYF